MVFRFDEFSANPEWVQRRTEVANYGSVQWEGIFTARTNEGNKLVQRHRSLNDIGSIDFQMPVFPFVPALLFLLRSYPIEETILLLFRPRDLDISLRRTESMAPRFSLSLSLPVPIPLCPFYSATSPSLHPHSLIPFSA